MCLHKPFLAAVAINAVLFLGTYLFFTPRFITNDDVGIMLWASGISAYSQPQELVLFSNILLGALLKRLYLFNLNIPWYGLYLVVCLFLSHCIFLYLALQSRIKNITLPLYLGYFLLLGIHLLLNLQYTIAAALLCMAGWIIMFYRLGRNTHNPSLSLPETITGILCVCLGSMVRWEPFIMATGLCFTVSLAGVLSLRFRQLLSPAIIALMTLALCFSLQFYNNSQYASKKEWDGFRSFMPLIVKFIDYKTLEKLEPAHKATLLSQAGLSENDYQMFIHWFFMDDTLYSQSNLESLISQISFGDFKVSVTQMLRTVAYPLKNLFVLKALLFLGLIFSFTFLGRNIFFTRLGLAVFISLSMLIYLYFFKKPAPERVYASIIAFLAILPIWSLSPDIMISRPFSRLRKIIFSFSCLAILFLFHFSFYDFYNQSDQNIRQQETFKNDIQNLTPRQSQLFVGWGTGIPWEQVSPFGDLTFLQSFMSFDLGVTERTPPALKRLQGFGVDDFYLDLVDNPDLFLVMRHNYQQTFKFYQTFMEEHYQIMVKAVPVHVNQSFTVLSLQTDIIRN
ncbi:MAG: hypothetical protein HQK83_03565 [Fibrobacteria bacterium]|nr:hypothetical protein [Fibrobacteria bacterium]